MLARTPYLTAQELGIREIEREYLERFVTEGEQRRLPEQHTFRMEAFLANRGGRIFDDVDISCGTVGCIAGTMDLYSRMDGRARELNPAGFKFMASDASQILRSLFMPHEHGCPEAILATLDQAVSCTKHFLQTGVVDWPLALGESA